MNKFWKIFTHEYTRHVLRKRFILALLSVPLWLLFSIGMGLLSIVLQNNGLPVAYIDQAHFMTLNRLQDGDVPIFTRVDFQPYASEAEARTALDAKKIQAYFVLPVDYQQTLKVRIVYREQPSNTVYVQLHNLLRLNWLHGKPQPIVQRVIEGPELVIQSTQENRKGSNNDWAKAIAPIAAGIFLIISIFTSSGYLMQAIVEEKENRTMEILVTSVSPGTIMSSKIMALICVGLTQILVWSIFPLVGLLLFTAYTPYLQSVSFDWGNIALVFLTVVPTFILISALMATLGATITEAREGQQISSLISLPVMAPVMLAALIVTNPNGLLAIILSIFPLTASMTLLMRIGFASVPTWQIFLSTGLLILSAIGALWLSGRVFRLGMLRYGKRMGWKDVFAAISLRRSRPAAQTDSQKSVG